MVGKELVLLPLVVACPPMVLEVLGEGSLPPLSLWSAGGVGVCDGTGLWGVVGGVGIHTEPPETDESGGASGAIGGFSND